MRGYEKFSMADRDADSLHDTNSDLDAQLSDIDADDETAVLRFDLAAIASDKFDYINRFVDAVTLVMRMNTCWLTPTVPDSVRHSRVRD